jgi:hypothetical protein
MGLLDKLKSPFTRNKCEKWVHYDKSSLTIQSLSVNLPPVKFSLADFQKETNKIRDASEFSELLDNYQYQMCRICNELGKQDEEWKKYIAIRAGMINLLTSLQSTLIAFKNDPDVQKPRLYDITGRLQDYVLLANTRILPNVEDLQSKGQISKGDVPEVNPSTVSKALDIAELDENEVNQFVEELKSQ